MIPYGRQQILDADIQAVINVLRSDFLTQGPIVSRFEEVVSKHSGVRFGVAVNSATSALHIACLALGLGSGDYLWTSPLTFVASANCGLYCGAKIDFVDIDPKTYNMSVESLEVKLAQAKVLGKLPKIVVPVHFAGQSCDMKGIFELSKEYGFRIIEDASHAIGGTYKGLPIGNCGFSDITVFSFHPVKIITSAEGGMALTNDAELATRMALLRSHGITRDEKEMTRNSDGPWYYEQIALGYNYRMTDLQAALGVSQMDRLDTYVSQRHALAKHYDNSLLNLPLILPAQHQDSRSSFHLYVVRLEKDKIKFTHREIFEMLRAEGVGVNLHYIPVHTHPYYLRMGFKLGDFPEAERYYRDAITLPLFPTLSGDQQDYVVEVLRRIFEV